MKNSFTKIRTDFGHLNRSQIDKIFPMERFYLFDILESEFSLQYKAWFIHNNCEFNITEYREFDIGCALCVLPIYELKYPKNTMLRDVLQEAQDCLEK